MPYSDRMGTSCFQLLGNNMSFHYWDSMFSGLGDKDTRYQKVKIRLADYVSGDPLILE